MRQRFARFRDALSAPTRWTLLLGFTGAALIVAALLPRIPQPGGFHRFADERALFGIPYSLDVLSNLPFLMVGLAGLWWIARNGKRFRDQHEIWPAVMVFAGLVTTAFGSGYYHLDPNNQTLVFDRLGMVIAFMSLFPLAIAERVDPRWGARLLAPFVALGVGTVLYWNWTELHGAGDLRWYGLAQAYAFVGTAGVLLFTRPAYDRQSGWLQAIGCYGLAKLFELLDQPAYWATGHAISGHSLKHIAAAAGGYLFLRMLQQRRALRPAESALPASLAIPPSVAAGAD